MARVRCAPLQGSRRTAVVHNDSNTSPHHDQARDDSRSVRAGTTRASSFAPEANTHPHPQPRCGARTHDRRAGVHAGARTSPMSHALWRHANREKDALSPTGPRNVALRHMGSMGPFCIWRVVHQVWGSGSRTARIVWTGCRGFVVVSSFLRLYICAQSGPQTLNWSRQKMTELFRDSELSRHFDLPN